MLYSVTVFFDVVAKGKSLVHRLVDIYLKSIETFLDRGDNIETINKALWAFGFERLPAAIQKIFGHGNWSDDFQSGRDDGKCVDDVLKPLAREQMEQCKKSRNYRILS